MDATKVFRKVALERMSSPEQLDRLLQVTTPKTWLALLSLIALLVVAVAWAYWGELTTRVSGQGVLIQSDGVDKLEAVLYVPAEKANELRPGMEAEILPTTLKREEYGFIRGTVVFVSDYPATEAAVMRVVQNAPLVRALSGGGPVFEVRVEMQADNATPSGYRWSSRFGAPVKLRGGTRCVGEIVTRRQNPISLLIPEIKSAIGVSDRP